ncbi:hypothetical protein [Amycolatopsis samaneae]|uniref:Uncharacterized protein n=1 Tax=Amycolatopsis samaneae TaxID=664691 RepID=A0ABW5GEG2_9PSEU
MIDHRAEAERILTGPPGKIAFRALCAVLGRAGSPPDLVAWCGERLAAWPGAVREAPWSWLAALEAGHERPGWPLVRSLALRTTHLGVRDLPPPDPRTHPVPRTVTHLDLGAFAGERLAALTETLRYWENLRSVRVSHLTELDTELIARLATLPELARLDSLVLVNAGEDLFHFQKPPFRPPAGPPWRLRHVGLRAPDLVHLLRSGLVPELRSAEVLISDTGEARELAACAELARLHHLAIGFRCGWNKSQPLGQLYFGNVIEQDDEACEEFFTHADLTGLRGLTVRGVAMLGSREGLGARGVAAIVAGGVPRQLTELTLDLLPIGDETIAGVVGALDPQRVEKLTLTDLVATDRTAGAFAAAGAFPRLRHLDLSRNLLGERGARRLADEVRLPALEHLDLSGHAHGSPYYASADVQPIGDPGAAAWAASPNATRLTHLNLAATGLGTDGLTALLGSERLRRLGTLDLSHNPLGRWPATVRHAPVWRTLHTLDLAECGLGDEDAATLTATDSPYLRSVSLAYNAIGTPGARALAAWPVLPWLWELNLHDNVIGDEGLTALATSRAAGRLLELDLEQDCWNARARFQRPLPAAIADEAAFPSLDAMFLGVVDEYHGARYSAGFPAPLREELVSAATTHPALVAFLTHLEMNELEDSEASAANDHDFRPRRAARHAESAERARNFADRLGTENAGGPSRDS